MSKWAARKNLRTRAQGIRRLVRAAMAVDDGYDRLQEAERLLRDLRTYVHRAVSIRLAKAGAGRDDPAAVEQLLADLIRHYPDIDRSTDGLAELLRALGEELKADDSTHS
jgi:hypothetical protein